MCGRRRKEEEERKQGGRGKRAKRLRKGTGIIRAAKIGSIKVSWPTEGGEEGWWGAEVWLRGIKGKGGKESKGGGEFSSRRITGENITGKSAAL